MAMQHGLEVGGERVAPPHFRLIMACVTACRGGAESCRAMAP
jgi:hypothetical protein